MIKQNQRWLNFANLLGDAALTYISYFLAVWMRFDLLGGNWSVDMTSGFFLAIMLGYCVILLGVYYFLQVYSSGRYKRASHAAFAILAANLVCTLMLSAVLFFLKEADFSRGAILLFFCISSFLVITKHVVGRYVLICMRRKGYNLKHVVVVGDGRLASRFSEEIAANPQLGVCIDGYVGDQIFDETSKRLGSIDDLGKVLSENDIDEIVIALDQFDDVLMRKIIYAAYKEGLRVNLLPTYNDFIPPNPTINVVGDVKLINLNACPLDNIVLAGLKRTMDIVLATIAILLLSPVMIFAAIGVKLSSPGPIFFKQERVGKDKKVFKMLKFRSMRVNAKESTGWSTNSDPRKTAFGSFIRKCSIDELPQLFNVVGGSMSLVGPRPEVPFHVGHFKEEIPQYLVRQQVRPGITGWAQINGLRGDTSIEERVKYDLWYIDNWTLRLDIEILIKTALGGFMNEEKVGAKQK